MLFGSPKNVFHKPSASIWYLSRCSWVLDHFTTWTLHRPRYLEKVLWFAQKRFLNALKRVPSRLEGNLLMKMGAFFFLWKYRHAGHPVEASIQKTKGQQGATNSRNERTKIPLVPRSDEKLVFISQKNRFLGTPKPKSVLFWIWGGLI